MKVIGVILEANPFHNGHQYLVDEIKKTHKPDCLIAVMSTYFSMRGDLTCISKKNKINALLDAGFDLVFELPISLSMHKADIFARNAVSILKEAGITHLAFGCETSDLSLINKVIAISNSTEFINNYNSLIKDQIGHKKAFLDSMSSYLTTDELQIVSEPNFTLGLFYLKELQYTNIESIIIKRIGSYNELIPTNNITSASAIRNLLLNNEETSNYTSLEDFTNISLQNKNIMLLLKQKMILENYRLPYDIEGIGNYIVNNGDFNLNYDEFSSKLANKKYTKTRIRRYLINLLLNNTIDNKTNIPYLRLLGANKTGFNYISKLDKTIKSYIFSSPNKNVPLDVKVHLELEITASKLFNIINETNDLIEFQLPLRKD